MSEPARQKVNSQLLFFLTKTAAYRGICVRNNLHLWLRIIPRLKLP